MNDSCKTSGLSMHESLLSFLEKEVIGCQPTMEQGEAGDKSVVINPQHTHQVCRTLKDHPEWDFHILQLITGCDYLEPDPRIEVSYLLTSLKKNHDLILKVKLPRENPSVDSVSDIWASANFQERECFDMVGVTFDNHPDPRRILCPDDWEGYPLRRDYQVQKSWHGMKVEPEHKMNLPEREFETRQKAMAKEHEKREQ